MKTRNLPLPQAKNLEKRLLMQAIIASILFNIFNVFTAWMEFLRPNKTRSADDAWIYIIAVCGSNLSFTVFHYSQVIFLILLSPKTRDAFLRFYKIRRRSKESSFGPMTKIQPSRI
ncbi:hypothetical protein FO519_004477 [Halicephalobus sp. NKZ332]|nr:hypothetical protein FO519_004477 [Halicephalobus sp. NKZ332]